MANKLTVWHRDDNQFVVLLQDGVEVFHLEREPPQGFWAMYSVANNIRGPKIDSDQYRIDLIERAQAIQNKGQQCRSSN